MKTLKSTIIVLFTFTSIASFGLNLKTNPILKPKTNFNQPFGPKKPPIFQIGDWNSAGAPAPAPTPPYVPPYEFSYKCQVQLSDQLMRTDAAGETYQFFAIAEFELNNKNTQIQSENLEWFGKKFYGVEKIPDTKEPIPFSTDGQSVAMYIRAGYEGKEDSVELSAHLKQKFGTVGVYNSSRVLGARDWSSLNTTAYTNVQSETAEQIPRMMMRVLCTKEK